MPFERVVGGGGWGAFLHAYSEDKNQPVHLCSVVSLFTLIIEF